MVLVDKSVSMKKIDDIDEAIIKLKEGNLRFIDSKKEGMISASRRLDLKDGQYPFATILGCSDSRVPIELIFDQGLGDLFIVRTAGNIVDDICMGSLEYGGDHLKTPILMVLGHQNCGAVVAASKGEPLPSFMNKIAEDIKPSVDKVKAEGVPEDQFIDRIIRENIKRVMELIPQKSTLLKNQVDNGTMKIIGGYYSFDTGLVELIE